MRQRIGYVPQMLSAKLHGMPRAERGARIQDALDLMGFAEAADRLVKTYSGGMIRRLELAQAMFHRPAVRFLDEPTIGLDPVARHSVWDRLFELRQAYGMTVLISTHDMEEADHLCDKLAILHQGRVAAVGPEAGLDDVFLHIRGSALQEGGSYRDVRTARRTAPRLG